MPEQRIYRQTLKARMTAIIAAIAVPVILLLSVLGGALIFGPPVGELGAYIDWLFIGLIVLMPLVAGVFVVYWAVFAWKDRIVTSDIQIERTGLHHFRIYRGPINFDDVVRVARGNFGLLRIEQVNGRNFELAPKAYEGGPDALLADLRKHLPADRFEHDLEVRLYKRTGREWRGPALMFVGVLILLLSSCAENLYDGLRADRAWTTEVEAKALRESIEDFDLAPDGSIWLLIERSLSDYQDPQSYEVRRITSAGTTVLEFPPFEVLYPDGPPEIGRGQPEGIRVTPEGIPRVFMF
ncbi:MAG: hypothetical protein ACC700_14845 [Anaerolineales bacterium]